MTERVIPLKSTYPTKDYVSRTEYEHIRKNIDNIEKKIFVAEDKTSGSFFVLKGHGLVRMLFETNTPEILAEVKPINSEKDLMEYYFENGGKRIEDLRILEV